MPKSGQLWQPGVLGRSALLGVFRELAEPLVARESWPQLEDYTALAERERRARAPELGPVCFQRPALRRRRPGARQAIELAQLYDGSIVLERRVPCLSESYHDLFNALAWAAFPRAKRGLHERQFRALGAWLTPGAARLPNQRTREQDALTLLDEGGAVLVTGAPVCTEDAGRGGPRRAPRPGRRILEASAARVVLFGHALMEHVCFEARPVRAAALVLPVAAPLPAGARLLELVDRALAARLSAPGALLVPDFDGVLSIEPPEAVTWSASDGRPLASLQAATP